MKSLIKLSLVAGVSATLLITSCRKQKEVDNDTGAAADNNMAERMFEEVKNITDAAANGYLNSTGYKSMLRDTTTLGCATVTSDTTTSPRTLTIDYGPTNCECADGRNRRGKIIVSYTGRYRAVGTVITHTFDNFFINDNQVLGTKTVTNSGLNSAGHTYFTVHVDGSIIKSAVNGGGTITWTSDRVREWIAGESTILNVFDDMYSITGTASGTRADGTTFTASITNPLIIDLSCLYRLVQGTVVVTPSGKPTRTFDYGDGNCDNNATVTVNGNTYNFTIWKLHY